MSKSSIDQAEVAKFSSLAHKWWDQGGEFKILHQINPLRLAYLEQKLTTHFTQLTLAERQNLPIIDVGCGGGILTYGLAKRSYSNISAIDASPENIAMAIRANHQNLPINYFCATPEHLIAENQQFDVVICLEVVEHVANVEHFLRSLAALVKTGGLLIISTINRNIKSYLQAIIAAEYILGWVPKHTHAHNKFLKPAEIQKILALSMNLQELKGLSYDLAAKKWFLSDDVSVNYFTCFAKI